MTTASTSHALWHPFADMGSVDGDRMVITRAEGPWVWDDSGRSYLDATAALWYSNLGHGRDEIADAVRAEAQDLVLERLHVVVRHAGGVGDERSEALGVGGDPADARAHAVGAVVAAGPADQVHTLRLAVVRVVTARELGRGLDHVPAAGTQEHAAAGRRRQGGHTVGELQRRLVRVVAEDAVGVERPQLVLDLSLIHI